MIADLKPYPAYKDSGVPWLGQVPEHWVERRAKYLFHEVDDRSTTGQEELLSVSHITGVTPRSQKAVTMFMAASYVGHKLCRPGDLVINTMWAWMGALGVATQSGMVSPAYAVYRPRRSDELLPAFVDHQLRTPLYVSEYICRSTGVQDSRLRLYPEQFLRIPLACPPGVEQQSIVAFLRILDNRIRRYIRGKQKLITLLNEQKQAIIHRAVTRGLDPSVRLKPSGVEWLGDVPEHWEVVPFKRRVGIQEGPGIMAADFRDSGVPLLLRISCVQGDVATLQGCNHLDRETVHRRWRHFAVRKGDYLLSASASTGSVALAAETVAGAIPYTGIIRLWPVSPNTVMPFVSLFMRSRPFKIRSTWQNPEWRSSTSDPPT